MKNIMALIISLLFIFSSVSRGSFFEYEYVDGFSRYNRTIADTYFQEQFIYCPYGIDKVHLDESIDDGGVLGVIADKGIGALTYIHYMETGLGEEPFISNLIFDPFNNRYFEEPYGAAVDRHGLIAVADHAGGSVKLFRYIDEETSLTFLTEFINLSGPKNVDIAEMGTPENEEDNLIIIADTDGNRVICYEYDNGGYTMRWEYNPTTPPDVLNGPMDAVVTNSHLFNDDFSVFIVDTYNERLVRLDNISADEPVLGGYYSFPDFLFFSIDVDTYNNLYLTDIIKSKLIKIKPLESEYLLLHEFGNTIGPDPQLNFPRSVTVEENDPDIFVAEAFSDESGIVCFDIDLEIDYVYAYPDHFDPITDSEAIITFQITDYARNVEVLIKDQEDQVVRHLVENGEFPSGINEICWDGRNDQGQIVPYEAEYTIVLNGEDAYGIIGEPDVYATQEVSGTIYMEHKNIYISSDTVWSELVVLYPNTLVEVAEDAALEVLPGTYIHFHSNSEIIVHGSLILHGLEDDLISMIGFNMEQPPPKGITVYVNDNSETVIENVEFNALNNALSLLVDSPTTTQITLQDCFFRYNNFALKIEDQNQIFINNCNFDNNEIGVYADNSRVHIDNTVFYGQNQYGAYFLQCITELTNVTVIQSFYNGLCFNRCPSGLVEGCTIYSNANAGLDYYGIDNWESSLVFLNNTINGNSGPGISAYSNSYPVLRNYQGLNAANNIHDNTFTELYQINSSYVMAGGHNNIVDPENSYLMYDETDPPRSRDVTGNYWGDPNGPDPTHFYPQASFIYQPFDVEENSYPINTVSGDIEVLMDAIQHELNGQFNEALLGYSNLLNNYPATLYATAAYQHIIYCAEQLCNLPIWIDYLDETGSFDASDAIILGYSYNEDWGTVFEMIENKIESASSLQDSVFAVIDSLVFSLISNGSNILNEGEQNSVNETLSRIRTLRSLDASSISNNIPKVFRLHQNYPNPFNPATTIRFDLPEAGNVSLTVYDIAGREVAKLIDGFQTAGSHSITFDGTDLASGIYFARLRAGEFVKTRKMLLIK